jgi:regulator of sigma E protease
LSLSAIFFNTVPFVCVLTVVVFFHEMGHFLVGRWCGVKVDAFSLGFGPELCHYTDRKGTRWRLALLPLGGYVKFHGDANGASVPDEDAAATMPASERSVTLFGQSVAKRAAIVAAGPIANFIVAIVIFAGLFHFNGQAVIDPQIGSVFAGSAAETAGFKAKDRLVSIDGQPIQTFEDMQRIVQTNQGAPIQFVVKRDGQDVTLTATPRRQVLQTRFGEMRTAVLGVTADASAENIHFRRYGVVESLGKGATETWFVVQSTGSYLKGLVVGRESTDQLSGPIRIAEVSGQLAKIGIAPLINLAAILSISIGLLNLLPIPMLDGGFLLFFAFEAIRGKALGERVQQVGFRIGLTFVAVLTIFAAFNDISRLAKPFLH